MNLKDLNIFVSYGHDEYLPLAQKLVDDLSAHVGNIWFDRNNIKHSDNWADEIARGIEECDVVLALMTKHAYRRPTGVCTNEIIYASNHKKNIRPILVENMDLPFLLCSIQYFEISDVFDATSKTVLEDKYQDRFKNLLAELQSGNVSFKGHLNNVKGYLSPQDNISEICQKVNNFVGREWMKLHYETWVEGKSNLLFILGKPGSGKSAFLAKLSVDYKDIKGVHFCKFSSDSSINVSNIIKSIAYYLIMQVEEYRDHFGSLDLESLEKMNPEQLFVELIKTPIDRSFKNSQRLVIAIDALDEMDREQCKILIKILTKYMPTLPGWFKLILTSRSNPFIVQQLSLCNPIYLEVECEENHADLEELIENSKAKDLLSASEKAQLIEKSQGIIHYISLVLSELEASGKSVLQRLSGGVAELYEYYFDSRIGQEEYIDLREILAVMCRAKESLSIEIYNKIFQEYKVAQLLDKLKDYIEIKNGKLSFMHKTVYDWLCDITANTKYCISKSSGDSIIANWIKSDDSLWEEETYVQKYGFAHLFDIKDTAYINELLLLENETIIDSFARFLLAKIQKDGTFDKPVIDVLKKLNTTDPRGEIAIAKLILLFCEHSLSDVAHSYFLPIFRALPWLKDYARICECRLTAEWEELKALGEKIQPQIKNQAVFFDLYTYMGDAYRLSGFQQNAFKYYSMVIDMVPVFERAEKCFLSIYSYYDLRMVRGFLAESECAMREYQPYIENDYYKTYRYYRFLGNTYFLRGDSQSAYEYFEKSLECAQNISKKISVAEAYYSMAECLTGVDNEKALQLLTTSREICNNINSAYTYAKTYFASIERLVNMEKWEEVLEEGEKGVNALDGIKYITGIARAKISVAKAHYHLGNYEKSIETATMPLERFKSIQSYPMLRMESFLIILKSAKKLGKLQEFINKDTPAEIPNLSEFPKAEALLNQINDIING